MSTTDFPWRDKPYPFDDANPPVEDDRPLWTSAWLFMGALMVWAFIGGTTIIIPLVVFGFSSLAGALDSRKPKWRAVLHAVLCGLTISAIIPILLINMFL